MSSLFAPAEGSRPEVLAGLVHGVAVGCPLLVGVAVGAPESGALACLGTYVAAFTNKGGPRGRRTAGLVVAATVNALAFWAGELVTGLFLLALLLLIALVFLASMGEAVHGTVARLGTMPATALLAGAGQAGTGPAAGRPGYAALLVLAGGLWYATATAVLTPTPRLRGVLADVAGPYREAAHHLARTAAATHRADDTGHARTVAALRRAEAAARTLRGPGGDERLAGLVEPLLHRAAELVDLAAALAWTGAPPEAVRREFTAAAAAAADHLDRTARLLTHPGSAPPSPVPEPALAELTRACDALRARVATGHAPYEVLARAGRQRRLLVRIDAATATARHRAAAVAYASGTRLHPGAAPERGFDAARLRAAMTLDSTTYRHALRITAVSAAVFALVGAVGLPHGEWATLAVLRVLRPQFGATLQRAGQRVAGNLIGGTCAALLIAGVSGPAALAVLLFAVISAGFALRPVNYTFWVIFGTPLVLLLGDVADPGDWQAAFERIGMTVIGSAAALLGGYLLWPTWDHDRLAERTAEAGRAATGYLDTTLDRLVRPHDPARPRPALRADEARRTAEGALAKAWASQRQARTEPGHDPAAVASAAIALEGLAELMEHLGALGAHATPAPPYLPGLAEYGAHAPAALTAKSPQERAAHADAVSDVVDGMRLHLAGLHARRLAELEAHGDDDTPTRRALRAGEPVVVLLATIAECVGRLSRRPW